MRIATSSDVLIVGVSPVTLAFAILLAKRGLQVLVIDELAKQPREDSKQLNLSSYCGSILKEHSYTLENKTTEQDFIAQSLTLLAHNLCAVIWETKLLDASNSEQKLLHKGTVENHQTSFVFLQSDLEIVKENNEANFVNIIVLAWRVIGTQLKKFHPFILNSFEDERQLIGAFYTHKKESWFKFLEKFIPKNPNVLTLKNSPINLHLSQQRNLQAGDRLPDLPFYNEKLKQPTSLHQCCSYETFTMMIIGIINPQFLFSIAKWVQFNFGIKLFYIPYSEKNDLLFKTLHLSPSEKRTFIIRPDKYIALINDTVDTDIIDNFLRNVLLMFPLTQE